jgi:hypothetical protein
MRIFLLCILLAGCADKALTIVSEEDIGVIVDAQAIPVAFNAANKMQVKTDKMFVVLAGLHEIRLGERASIRVMSNGDKYLCTETSKYCPRLW